MSRLISPSSSTHKSNKIHKSTNRNILPTSTNTSQYSNPLSQIYNTLKNNSREEFLEWIKNTNGNVYSIDNFELIEAYTQDNVFYTKRTRIPSNNTSSKTKLEPLSMWSLTNKVIRKLYNIHEFFTNQILNLQQLNHSIQQSQIPLTLPLIPEYSGKPMHIAYEEFLKFVNLWRTIEYRNMFSKSNFQIRSTRFVYSNPSLKTREIIIFRNWIKEIDKLRTLTKHELQAASKSNSILNKIYSVKLPTELKHLDQNPPQSPSEEQYPNTNDQTPSNSQPSTPTSTSSIQITYNLYTIKPTNFKRFTQHQNFRNH